MSTYRVPSTVLESGIHSEPTDKTVSFARFSFSKTETVLHRKVRMRTAGQLPGSTKSAREKVAVTMAIFT